MLDHLCAICFEQLSHGQVVAFVEVEQDVEHVAGVGQVDCFVLNCDLFDGESL